MVCLGGGGLTAILYPTACKWNKKENLFKSQFKHWVKNQFWSDNEDDDICDCSFFSILISIQSKKPILSCIIKDVRYNLICQQLCITLVLILFWSDLNSKASLTAWTSAVMLEVLHTKIYIYTKVRTDSRGWFHLNQFLEYHRPSTPILNQSKTWMSLFLVKFIIWHMQFLDTKKTTILNLKQKICSYWKKKELNWSQKYCLLQLKHSKMKEYHLFHIFCWTRLQLPAYST